MIDRARKRWHGATLLCITHDVADTLEFDRVLVIEDGRVVEDGAPTILAAQAETRYAQLLEAERVVRNDLWQGGHWRRMRLEGGRLTETRAKEAHGGADR